MMFKRRKRKVPGLNTASTADISFMLLIFFLVASSMESEKGLLRQLPPPQNEHVEQEQMVKQRNVLQVSLDAADCLRCGDSIVTLAGLTARVAEFVANEGNAPSLPEKSTRDVNLLGPTEVSDRHVIAIQVDRNTSYEAYFQMQNAIVAAYSQLRNRLALKLFGRPFGRCSAEQQATVAMVYPQRISESAPSSQEGGQP